MAAKEQAVLEVSVTGVDKAASQFSSFQQTTTKTMSASEAAVTRSLKNMAAQFIGIAAVARSVQNVVSSGVGFDQFVENTTMSFTVMMKSAEKAKTQMKDLYDFAVNSPLTFKETAASSKQLMAYGFTAEELIPTMKTLGSVAIATGHSLDDISYVYGTLKSQGRAYSRDLMQFGMRGIPIYEELAKVMNVNVKQIQKMASEGKIGFGEVEKAFQNMTTGSGRFSGIIEGYMTTLTGKLSMLSDIGQQTMGTLMSGVTAQIKILVDSLTKSLSSSGMKLFIQNLANDLTAIASVLRVLITFVVDNIGIITTALKIWMASQLFNGAVKALNIDFVAVLATVKDLAAVFKGLGIGGVATVFSAAINSSNTAIGKLFAQIAASITLILSPMGILISSIIAVGVALKLQNDEWKKSAIAAKTAADNTVRMAQFMKDYSSAAEKAHGSLWQYMKNIVGLNKELTSVNPANVTKLAEEYNLSTQAVADALIYQGLLTQEAWKTYQAVNATKDAQAGKKQAMTAKDYVNTSPMASTLQAVGLSTDKLAEDALQATGMSDLIDDFESGVQSAIEIAFTAVATIGEPSLKKKEQDILANLTASGASTDFVANLAGLGVNSDAIESQTKDALTKRVATLTQYTTDLLARDEEVKKTYTDQMNSLIAQGLSTEDAQKQLGALDQNPRLLAWLVKQLNAAQLQLDGLGKKAKALKLIDIPKWWLPDEAATAATSTAIDDAELAAKKSAVSTEAEIEARKKALESNLALISSMDKGAEKTKLQVRYTTDLVELEKKRQKILDDIAKKTQKDIDVAKYNELISGKSGFWTDLEANVANNMDQVAKKIEKLRAMNKDGSSAIDKTKQIGSVASSYAGAAAGTAVGAIQGTEVGSVLAGGNPILNAVLAIAKFALSIEAVQKVLNPVKTVLEQARSVLEPLITAILEPMTNTLEMSGDLLKQLLAPILGIIKILNNMLYLFDTWILVPLQMLGAGFEWFYNYVIVPVANKIVNIVNAIIRALNKIPFVHIKYLSSLSKMDLAVQSLTETINNQKSALDQTITYLTAKINNAIDKQLGSLKDLYEVGAITASDYEKQATGLNSQKVISDNVLVSDADKALTSMSDLYNRLYELYDLKDVLKNTEGLTEAQQSKLLTAAGLSDVSLEAAMKRAVFDAMVAYNAIRTVSEIDASKLDKIAKANTPSNTPSNTMGTVQNPIEAGVSLVAQAVGGSAVGGLLATVLTKTADHVKTATNNIIKKMKHSFGRWDVGSGNIPEDQFGMVHKGEGIIPATFMNSIRSGELALSSGKNEGSGQNVIVNVTVQGSVQTENDLATSIAQAIYVQRSRGALTV